MSLSEESIGGRAATDSAAQTDIQSIERPRSTCKPAPAASVAIGCPDLAARRFTLCLATLESIASQCMDGLELVRAMEDDGNGLPSRLLEGRLQLMGLEVDRTLKAVGSSFAGLDDWLMSPRQLQALQALEGVGQNNDTQPTEAPSALAIARALLDEGAAGADPGMMGYGRCSCDEAAGYLNSDPPRVADALEVVRMALDHAAVENRLEDRRAVTMLQAAERILRGEVVR